MATNPLGKDKHDFAMKLLVIGDSGVGKSCLLLRFANDTFTTQFTSTIGIDFKVRTVELDGKRVKLQIWDTAGQDRFRTITNVYYRDAHGILIVYDVTDEKSFEGLRYWLKNIQENAPENVDRVIVGNKCDLVEKRVISTNAGKEFAESQHLKFFETSAKESIGVEDAFMELANQVKIRVMDKPIDQVDVGAPPRESTVPIKPDPTQPTKKGSGCC